MSARDVLMLALTGEGALSASAARQLLSEYRDDVTEAAAYERSTLRAEVLNEAADEIERRVPDGQRLVAKATVLNVLRRMATSAPVPDETAGDKQSTHQPELVIYRASHEYESIVHGHYGNLDAAREHCEDFIRREEPAALLAFRWMSDDGEGPWDLHLVLADGTRVPTGYSVTPLTVAAAFDEEADE